MVSRLAGLENDQNMGQISVEITVLPGSALSGNQQVGHSAQLAVLATSPVDAGERWLFMTARLASDASPGTGQGFPTRLWDRLAAFFAVGEAGPTGYSRTRTCQRVLYAIVDLVLNGAVGRPAVSHGSRVPAEFVGVRRYRVAEARFHRARVRRRPGLSANLTHTGAWSLVFSHPRTWRSTWASASRSASGGLSRR